MCKKTWKINDLELGIIERMIGGRMSIKKHAYLIIAHTNFDQLQKLVKMLDNDKNDIFIHVDKKAKTFDKSLIYT